MSIAIVPHRPSLTELQVDLALIRAYRQEAQDEVDAGRLHFGPTLDRLIAEEDRLVGAVCAAQTEARRVATVAALRARGVGR